MLCQALYELEAKAGEGRWSLSRVLGAPWWGLARVGGVPVVSGDAMVVSRWCDAGVLVVPSWCLGSVSVDLGGFVVVSWCCLAGDILAVCSSLEFICIYHELT